MTGCRRLVRTHHGSEDRRWRGVLVIGWWGMGVSDSGRRPGYREIRKLRVRSRSMALVRQTWRAAGAIGCGLLAAACAHAPPAPPPPVPELATIDSSKVLTTVFLIGDAGAAASNKDRVLVELRRQGRAARRGSSIVFLGDNVYPRGIPERLPDTSRFNDARSRLFIQAEIADSTGLRIIFVPGNHDWARQGEDGWASVQRAELLLREYSKEDRKSVV